MNSNKTEELIVFFRNANKSFLADQCGLISSEVSEQCLCAQLSYYIKISLKCASLEGYHVDVEYNRNNGKVKTIINDDMKVIKIKCDLIIHSRGERKKDNIIAIEMKKSYRSETAKNNDKERLIALTKKDNIWSYDGIVLPEHVCGYDLGIYYEIDNKKKLILIEYYTNGCKYSEESINF